LIAKGLEDDVFTHFEGEDKEACSALKKINRDEKKLAPFGSSNLLRDQKIRDNQRKYIKSFEEIEHLDSNNITAIRTKETEFKKLVTSPEYSTDQLIHDAWCAAFFIKKRFPTTSTDYRTSNNPLNEPIGITERELRALSSGRTLKPGLVQEINQLAENYRFFHWHLAFPEVFFHGGFDLILGNPPWERVKLQLIEWFTERSPEIAKAKTSFERKGLIKKLEKSNNKLYEDYIIESNKSFKISHFIRISSRFPLCGRGDVNYYSVFAEAMGDLVNERGRVGTVIPSGIATDDTTKYFFQSLIDKNILISLFDFENKGIFYDVHSS
jgi:hypothetical protein